MTNSELPSELSEPARIILHPTDFTQQSDVALAHALRLALTNHAKLTMMHVDQDPNKERDRFPSIREILQRWGVLPTGASRSDVTGLGIAIEKVTGVAGSVAASIEGFCQRHPIDMIVLATAGRDGMA